MVSYFTPTHKQDTTLLKRCYESLKKQTTAHWQWIVLLNGDGIFADTSFLLTDNRVKTVFSKNKGNIGALKKEACSHATGDIIAELDHDDTITPDCTVKLLQAFNDTTIDFAYSDTYHRKADGTTFHPFSNYWGWKYSTDPDGNIITKSHDPSPPAFSWIFYAPDHIRAWRKSFYDSIGGHDTSLDVCDDFDLCCRSYIHGNTKRIPEPLYNYYHTGENTSGQSASDNKNARIQELTAKLHDKYIQDICLKYCKLNNLPALDLGGRFNSPKGFTSVDLLNAQIIADLTAPWPFPDSSIGLIRASHLLEHLPDTIHFFNQAFRVLKPGAFILIEVPSTSGSGAFSDPTHIKFFNQRSFQYYTNQAISQYIQPQFTGKFQLNRINEYLWLNSDVAVIQAHLICLKDQYEQNWIGEKLM
jgi:glycosyltransferase involved in cell wall biosynthesis